MRERVAPPIRLPADGELESLQRRVEELEGQLAQSQKLQAIGSLAGGVAHDFNNLLTAIVGYVSLLREDTNPPPHVSEALDVIEKAAERSAQLTSRLLGFARRGQPKRVRVDFHQSIGEVRELLRHTIGKHITVETKLDAIDPYVMGDPGQFFQVLLNLALNARDAMPEGGTLTIATAISDHHLRTSVIDTGTGIPDAIRERIFDPFFTTKEQGKGTGMGLTVVQAIIRSHGGRIEIECESPGTRFHVLLPLAMERLAVVAEDGEAVPSRGKGSILVVDDEEFVRQVAARMTKTLGYHVICFGSPREAIEYYRVRVRDIDVVLVDLVMPEFGGKEVFEKLREINPKARIVITSGYGQDPAVDALMDAGAKGFLQKPYRLSQLSEALATAMK
jgi:two-component system cell cycle sensor histidine kinase/response regulator CckA